MTTDNVRIEYYLGEYSGCDVLYITDDNSMYATVIMKETIAGYTFTYGSSQVPCVYKNGDFTVLKAAYENGWITKDDVRDLAEKHG